MAGWLAVDGWLTDWLNVADYDMNVWRLSTGANQTNRMNSKLVTSNTICYTAHGELTGEQAQYAKCLCDATKNERDSVKSPWKHQTRSIESIINLQTHVVTTVAANTAQIWQLKLSHQLGIARKTKSKVIKHFTPNSTCYDDNYNNYTRQNDNGKRNIRICMEMETTIAKKWIERHRSR